MGEQVVPSAVVQRLVVKYLTNENVKPAEILTRLRAHFVMKRSQGSRYVTGVSLKEGQRMKTCED